MGRILNPRPSMPITGSLLDESVAETYPVRDKTEVWQGTESKTISGIGFTRLSFWNAGDELVRQAGWTISLDPAITSVTFSNTYVILGDTGTFEIDGDSFIAEDSEAIVEIAFRNRNLIGETLGRTLDATDFSEIGYGRVGIIRASSVAIVNSTRVTGTINTTFKSNPHDAVNSFVKGIHDPLLSERTGPPYSRDAIRPLWMRVILKKDSGENVWIASSWFEALAEGA